MNNIIIIIFIFYYYNKKQKEAVKAVSIVSIDEKVNFIFKIGVKIFFNNNFFNDLAFD